MKAHIAYLLLKIRESFWFVPTLMVLASLALSHAALFADANTAVGAVAKEFWFGALDTSSARLVLSTVTGAMITTASLVFSLTLVSLTLASQQLGPRLLSMFLRDRMTQTVLGLFLATFIYALVVLMALGGDDGPVLVPMLAITIAVLATIASFVALIMFIHHLSTSLQADVVVSRVSSQLRDQIEAHFPSQSTEVTAVDGPEEVPAIHGRTICTTGRGYVQAIDFEELVAVAADLDLQIRILRRPGHFLGVGEPIAVVTPESMDPDEYDASLQKAIVFGEKRTAAQDLEFVVMAIVEIALRALSPGINDPHTANTCVDRLGEALMMVFARSLKPTVHRDGEGKVRLVTDEISYESLVDTAFNEIRQCAAGSVPVLIRLGEALERLARCATTDAQLAAVRRHCNMLERSAEAHVREPLDLKCIEDALDRVRQRLDGESGRADRR